MRSFWTALRELLPSETTDDSTEDVLERLTPRFTLGDVLGAVLQDSLAGDYVLHVHVSTPCRELNWVEAVD